MEQSDIIDDNTIPLPNDNEDDDTDDEMIPPLETIEKEMKNNQNKSKKNIVIPSDDDKNKKNENDDGDDGEKNGYLDILNNGDLRKKIIKKGNDIRPQRGSKVIIRLETRIYNEDNNDEMEEKSTGKLITGETFERFELVIGDNDLHQGLDLIIPLMELNEICRAIIKSRFAYGQLGNKQIDIPENATLDCQIELIEISNKNDDNFGQEDEIDYITNKVTIMERLKFGNYKKLRGNFWFERGEYSMAIQCYKGALKYLNANNNELKMIDDENKDNENKDNDNDMINNINDLIDKRAQTYNNLAAAQMKMDAIDTALRSVNDSLLLRPNNIKALFRHAKLLTIKGDIEDAIKELKKAILIDPKSDVIQLELNRLNKLLQKQINEQKALYRRMMQVKSDNSNTNTNNDNNKHSENNNNNNNTNNEKQNNNNNNNKQKSKSWYQSKWLAIMATVAIATTAAIYQVMVQ